MSDLYATQRIMSLGQEKNGYKNPPYNTIRELPKRIFLFLNSTFLRSLIWLPFLVFVLVLVLICN